MSDESLNKAMKIKLLLDRGRFSALYELVARISEFNVASESGRSMSAEEQDAWQYACLHLEFLTKYGPTKASVKDGKFLHFAYPVEFENWLKLGSPGVSENELDMYTAANPI